MSTRVHGESTPHYTLDNPVRMPYQKYRLSIEDPARSVLDRVVQAIGCILTEDGQVNGTALLIHNTFILTPKHCFPYIEGKIKFANSVIHAVHFLDGECDPSSAFKSDFKILSLEETHNLRPAPLSVEAPIGEGVQLNYQIDGNLYALPYQSFAVGGGYATRSDLANVITINGDSGGARYSWTNKAVASIHQGESEALTINQIGHAIESIKNTSQDSVLRERAIKVLNALGVSVNDAAMLRMHFSTVFLQPGQVIPERHGLFQCQAISSENIKSIPKGIISQVLEYLKSLKETQGRELDFFSKIPGGVGNMYRIPNHQNEVARIDRQVRVSNAANIQIQVGSQTIATILVHDQLYAYAQRDQTRIAAVINYVSYLFWRGVKRASYNDNAIVRFASLIGGMR